MRKTVIVLPDGREISSGAGADTAVAGCQVTRCVNSGTELTLGSACAAMAEVKLFTPAGGLEIAPGDELTVYQEADGARQKLGVFIAEKPERPSANTLRITAYDRITRLDQDLTDWVNALTGWPYPLSDLAAMVCARCGVSLASAQIPNGSFLVQPFTAQAVTGRQLIQWIGQAAGRFCRANADGALEFAWYTPAPQSVGPGEGQVYCFQGGLTAADYAVAPIDKVQLQASGQDVGVIYPADSAGTNAYRITANPLLMGASKEALQPVAQALYTQLQGVSYTPCDLRLPGNSAIQAGHILTVTDPNGRTFQAYIMTHQSAGQQDKLSCTGSRRRDSTAAVNEAGFENLSGRVLNLRMDVDGIRAENREAGGRLSKLELTVDGMSTAVQQQTKDAQALRTDLTALQQTAQAVQVSVQSIHDTGVSKVRTATDYTFDERGLRIAKSGAQVENLLDNTGMYVTRSGQTVLQAGSDGVVAADVQVHNYLCIGQNARLEDYPAGRTACFYTGG